MKKETFDTYLIQFKGFSAHTCSLMPGGTIAPKNDSAVVYLEFLKIAKVGQYSPNLGGQTLHFPEGSS